MKSKTVKVGDQICTVETLREWINGRITSLRKTLKYWDSENCEGRMVELLIIREKLNDGRIQEIG